MVFLINNNNHLNTFWSTIQLQLLLLLVFVLLVVPSVVALNSGINSSSCNYNPNVRISCSSSSKNNNNMLRTASRSAFLYRRSIFRRRSSIVLASSTSSPSTADASKKNQRRRASSNVIPSKDIKIQARILTATTPTNDAQLQVPDRTIKLSSTQQQQQPVTVYPQVKAVQSPSVLNDINGYKPRASGQTVVDDYGMGKKVEPKPKLIPEIFLIDKTIDEIIGEKDTRTPEQYNSMEEYLNDVEISSRPIEGGKWNVNEPLKWTTEFGRRSPAYEKILNKLIKLKPGDEGYYDISDIKVDGVAIVRTEKEADVVLEKLFKADPSILHACDTEVMDIDLKTVGPVGNGYVTCVSVYSGPDFDYGLGHGPGATLWIDNLDDSCGLLQKFKPWFEDERFLKVWHNYGFDRHVMWNEGINVLGFGGDTMHMARLQDTSRVTSGIGYSLEALTEELLKEKKQPMKDIFGIKRKRKDGTDGSLVDIPPVEQLQRDPKHRSKWIIYSAYDAKSTWELRNKLDTLLWKKKWLKGKCLNEYYWMHMRPFGEVLTDMERRGIRVNAEDYLAGVELQARKDRQQHVDIFREWAAKQIGPDGLALNTASSVQLCTFLFGGAENPKTYEKTETERIFKVPTEEIPEDAIVAYRLRDEAEAKAAGAVDEPEDELAFLDGMTAVHLKALCKEQGLKVSGKKSELQERLRDHYLSISGQGTAPTEENIPEPPVADFANDLQRLDDMKVADLKIVCKKYQLKVSGRKAELQERIRDYINQNAPKDEFVDEFDSYSIEDLKSTLISRNLSTNGPREDLLQRIRDDLAFQTGLIETLPSTDEKSVKELSQVLEESIKKDGSILADYLEQVKAKAQQTPKYIDVKISSLGLQPIKYTTGGAPSVTADVLKKLAGDPFADPPKYGTAYEKFGEEGCKALFSLCSIGSIDTMIANFLTSLQELADEQSRVHCSLNLNTETGRLSSRRPNLQNQPALEKDKYKIRKAFESSPGNNLIVADYGQLELRILASLTECKSMIDAFAAGGDFHSRTAMDMFPYIREKLDAGECLLEWDYSKGEPPKPLLKDMFASERRKAKTLNFSIAYGKTAHGLSQDWGVSTEEAEKMLQAWYDARPEVAKWQQETKDFARKEGITRTLMGRYRQLPKGNDAMKRGLFGRAQRASINTPIQGGAADIAMMAMNKINESKKLQRLGWILLLQIHDEVILEGPEETAEEAFHEVLKCMEEPWVFGLDKTSVPLVVDGSYKHKTWYDAK